MNAPTKHRSTKDTNIADSRVDFRRKRVAIAQAAARTETMKRVLWRISISIKQPEVGFDGKSTYRMSAGVSWFASVYLWTNQASIPKVGMRVTIWRKRQKVKKSPAIIVSIGSVCKGDLCARM